MIAWEYHTTQDAAALPALGQAGWELAGVAPGPDGAPVFYLKRPAPDFRERITLEQKAHYYTLLSIRPAAPEAPA